MTHHHLATASEVLRAEHEVIKHLLDAVDGMAEVLDRGEPVPRVDVERALDVIVGFADKCHHAKEEKVIFAALRDLGTPAALRVVRELEGDHMAGRKLVVRMRTLADAGSSGDHARARQLAHDARLYVALLREHIDHEDEQLLPLADALPARMRDHVSDALERIEREEAGAGAHERYERDVHELHMRYAGKASSFGTHSRAH